MNALQGLISGNSTPSLTIMDEVAAAAFKYADAMIRAEAE